MARRLPARVDWIVHKRTGIKVALRLDKKTMLFQAKYSSQTFQSKDGAEVRTQVLDAIEKLHQLIFKPVIEIEVTRRSVYLSGADFEDGIALAITRFYISQEGGLRQQKWDDHERNNTTYLKMWRPPGFKGKPEEFKLPFSSRPHHYTYGNDHYYLPYSEDAWEGLQKIIELIKTAKDRLNAFLGDPGMVAKLIAIGTGSPYPLVEAGDMEEE